MFNSDIDIEIVLIREIINFCVDVMCYDFVVLESDVLKLIIV